MAYGNRPATKRSQHFEPPLDGWQERVLDASKVASAPATPSMDLQELHTKTSQVGEDFWQAEPSKAGWLSNAS